MEQHLSVTAMPDITMDDIFTNSGSRVNVKDEPPPSIDMQEKVTTEPDNMMKVEDCTKSQLTSSEDNTGQKNDVEYSSFTIKIEPLPRIDIKKEATIEPDKLMKVEDCTTSQLTLSEDNSDQRNDQEYSTVTIKIEPMPSIDIKEEITTEPDKLMKVEDCTKSQLTLSEDNNDQRNDQEYSTVTIKIEPMPSIDIKEEITTEPEKFMKVENFTKSQFILAEDKSDQGKNVEKLLGKFHDEKTKPDVSKIQLSNSCNKKTNLNRELTTHGNANFPPTETQCSSTRKDTESTTLIEDKPIPSFYKKWWACKECDKKFDSESNLSFHLKSHSGEQPFACTICDKKFDCTGNLGRHIRSHTEEKSFACNVCDQQYNRKDRLDKHMRIHTGLKSDHRFTCNVCDKLFLSKFNLDRHMKIHTRKKP